MKVIISADSTCDLSKELVEKYAINIIPLSVTMGDKTYKDGVEMKPDDIYDYVSSTGELPKTSAVNVADYEMFFKKYSGQGNSVVHFCIGAEFSSTYMNACTAASEYSNVYVVDSRNLSTGQGLLVLHAAEMAQQGCDAETISKECRLLTEKVEASFVIDRLDYLYKGGRCSSLAALGANVLRIKPSIRVKDGKMVTDKKYRGKYEQVVLNYVEDCLSGREDIDLSRVFITHTKCSEECVRHVREKVQELQPGFKEILETTAGATITTHCGPNTLGVLFMRK